MPLTLQNHAAVARHRPAPMTAKAGDDDSDITSASLPSWPAKAGARQPEELRNSGHTFSYVTGSAESKLPAAMLEAALRRRPHCKEWNLWPLSSRDYSQPVTMPARPGRPSPKLSRALVASPPVALLGPQAGATIISAWVPPPQKL